MKSKFVIYFELIFIFFFFLRKFIFIQILRNITLIAMKKVHNMDVYMHID